MEGKTVVITGASAGVGAAAARRLAEYGATVVVVGRNPEKTAAVAREVGAEPLTADFEKLADVRRLAEQLRERCPHIDVLANNAGGYFPKQLTTEDGNERTFQVNHLAPFLLTQLLEDRVGRLINTSSVGNNFGRIRLDDLNWERRRWSGLLAYSTAKLANILHAQEFARRTGKLALSFHPGNVASDFGRDSLLAAPVYRTPLRKIFLISPTAAGDALVALATRDDLQSGYFDRFKENGRTSRQAKDPELARGLWDASEALV
ncbi:MAG: hypothetical protein QOF76_2633 [Solirubrobacteraceae bacterium]|jgi:NAD(P)-dependent dehydrogenase (short-subunit alcohol dehydrogenase family)|nr:hypothetical protein [Solirubrobacteraceae bacterium]